MTENIITLEKFNIEDIDNIPLGPYFVKTINGNTYLSVLKECTIYKWSFKPVGKRRRFVNLLSKSGFFVDEKNISYIAKFSLEFKKI